MALPYQTVLKELRGKERQKVEEQKADTSFQLPYEKVLTEKKEEVIQKYDQQKAAPVAPKFNIIEQSQKYAEKFIQQHQEQRESDQVDTELMDTKFLKMAQDLRLQIDQRRVER